MDQWTSQPSQDKSKQTKLESITNRQRLAETTYCCDLRSCIVVVAAARKTSSSSGGVDHRKRCNTNDSDVNSFQVQFFNRPHTYMKSIILNSTCWKSKHRLSFSLFYNNINHLLWNHDEPILQQIRSCSKEWSNSAISPDFRREWIATFRDSNCNWIDHGSQRYHHHHRGCGESILL